MLVIDIIQVLVVTILVAQHAVQISAGNMHTDLKDSEEEDLYDDYNYDDDDEAEDSNNDGNDYSDYDDMEDDDGVRDSSNIARRLWST